MYEIAVHHGLGLESGTYSFMGDILPGYGRGTGRSGSGVSGQVPVSVNPMKEKKQAPETKDEIRGRILAWRRSEVPKTFSWIAKELGISRGRAYQQFRKALDSVEEREV